jgi:predicted MFS family arabinose efflux permease
MILLNKQLYVASARSFFVFTLLLMLFSQAAVSISSWPGIKGKLVPELDRKALSISVSMSTKIERALDYGVPLEELTGVDTFFDEVLRQTDGISYLALSTLDGTVIVSRGIDNKLLQQALSDSLLVITSELGRPVVLSIPGIFGNQSSTLNYRNTSLKVLQKGETEKALVHVGFAPGHAERKVSDLKYDVLIVFFASLLIGFEVLLAVLTSNFIAPLKSAAGRIERMASGNFSNPFTSSSGSGGIAAGLNARIDQIIEHINATYSNAITAAHSSQQSTTQPVLAALKLIRERLSLGQAADGLASHRDIVRVRILTFIFMFASMLSRPFLPVYLGEIADRSSGLSAELSSSIPITVYLACMALCMPYAGRWSDRHGRRNSYMLGALLMAGGLLGTALAGNFWVLVFSRAVEGIGYAMLFMSCQGYVVDNTSAENRSRGVATFVSAIMVSEVCAPAVGGVLADSMGFRGVLSVAALLSIIALPLAWKLLSENGNTSNRKENDKSAAGYTGESSLLRNSNFMTISIFAAIPSKILLSGFLIFLTPIVLVKFGSSTSEIGRFVILYGIIALLAMPLFSMMGDRYRCHFLLVIVGGLISGISMLPIAFEPSSRMLLLGILGLGLGQAMSISSQLTLISRSVQSVDGPENASSALGLFRLIERIGGALGPVIAGIIALHLGPVSAIPILGAAMVSSTIFCLLIIILLRKRNKRIA